MKNSHELVLEVHCVTLCNLDQLPWDYWRGLTLQNPFLQWWMWFPSCVALGRFYEGFQSLKFMVDFKVPCVTLCNFDKLWWDYWRGLSLQNPILQWWMLFPSCVALGRFYEGFQSLKFMVDLKVPCVTLCNFDKLRWDYWRGLSLQNPILQWWMLFPSCVAFGRSYEGFWSLKAW
jgi:hypothetical protein